MDELYDNLSISPIKPKNLDNLNSGFNLLLENENYSFYELGFNFRPTEISGFIGNCQISYIEEMVNIREYNFKKLYDASILNDNLITLKVKHMNKVSNFAFPLVFKSKEICRKYRNQFKNNNIEIRPIVGGNITQQPF